MKEEKGDKKKATKNQVDVLTIALVFLEAHAHTSSRLLSALPYLSSLLFPSVVHGRNAYHVHMEKEKREGKGYELT